MAAVTDVKIINNDNSKEFLFRGVTPFEVNKTQPPISIPLVNTSSENTILFRFIGQSEFITFSFALFDDSTDVSNGTSSSAITTVNEQIEYLKDIIFTDNFDVDWKLIQSSFFPSDVTGITGVISDLKISKNAGQTTVAFGSITFQRGFLGAA